MALISGQTLLPWDQSFTCLLHVGPAKYQFELPSSGSHLSGREQGCWLSGPEVGITVPRRGGGRKHSAEI